MKQTDAFGDFNRLIRRYSQIEAEMITHHANHLRFNLECASDPTRTFYDIDAYLDSIIRGYRMLVRMVR